MSALHYIGRNDRLEDAFMINAHQEQALMLTLLQGRHPSLYERMYGQRHVRAETRGVSGKNMVMPFN